VVAPAALSPASFDDLAKRTGPQKAG